MMQAMRSVKMADSAASNAVAVSSCAVPVFCAVSLIMMDAAIIAASIFSAIMICLQGILMIALLALIILRKKFYIRLKDISQTFA